MHKIHVESIPILGLIRLQAVYPVIIGLHLDIGPAFQLPFPACQQIAARELRILLHSLGGWRRKVRDPDILAGNPVVDIALNRQRIVGVDVPVGAETALRAAPIVKLLVIGMVFGACVDALSVDPVIEAVVFSSSTAAPTLPEIQKALIHRATTCRDKSPSGVFGVPGDDIDHAVDGVRSPDGAARPANDFDTVDILEQRVLHLPIDTVKERVVNTSAIDQHQQVPRQAALKSPDTDGPFDRVDLSHVNPRSKAERFGQTSHTGAPDIFLRDDEDRRGGLGELYRTLGNGCNFDVAQLFKAQTLETPRRGGIGLLGAGQRREKQRDGYKSGMKPHNVPGRTTLYNTAMPDQYHRCR
jgi:hypothetical protein